MATEDKSILSLALSLWALCWPAMIRNYFNCASDRITLAFVGHYDFNNSAHYDGASLGKMYSNTTGLSVGLGLNVALCIYSSQAFGRKRTKEENGIQFKRAMIILFVAFLYSTLATVFAEDLLAYLGQPLDVSRTSARFAQVQWLGTPTYWIGNAIANTLDGLQTTKPGMYSSLVSSTAQIALCYFCVSPAGLNMGYLGMALARSLGGYIYLAILYAYVKYNRLEDYVWRIPTNSSVKVWSCSGILNYLAVSLPSALILWAEWWAFEALAIIVGLLPDAETILAAHGTLFNTVTIFYMTFTGLSQAVTATIGKNIGAHETSQNSVVIVISCFICGISSAAICAILWEFKSEVAELFTEDENVISEVEGSMLGVILSVPTYGFLMTLYGVCRGANQQKIAALGTAIGYYGFGIPLAYYLGKVLEWPNPLLGVWFGNVAALGFSLVVVTVVVVRIDWSHVMVTSLEANADVTGSDYEAADEHGNFTAFSDQQANDVAHD